MEKKIWKYFFAFLKKNPFIYLKKTSTYILGVVFLFGGCFHMKYKSFCQLFRDEESIDKINSLEILFTIIWYRRDKKRLSYLPTPPLGQDMTQGQFLSGVYQVSIQSFVSTKLVSSPRLKNLVCHTIYP